MTHPATFRDPSAAIQALLTVRQVATVLQTSTRTVQRLIDRGELDVVRIGRLVRVRPEALAALIDRK